MLVKKKKVCFNENCLLMLLDLVEVLSKSIDNQSVGVVEIENYPSLSNISTTTPNATYNTNSMHSSSFSSSASLNVSVVEKASISLPDDSFNRRQRLIDIIKLFKHFTTHALKQAPQVTYHIFQVIYVFFPNHQNLTQKKKFVCDLIDRITFKKLN